MVRDMLEESCQLGPSDDQTPSSNLSHQLADELVKLTD